MVKPGGTGRPIADIPAKIDGERGAGEKKAAPAPAAHEVPYPGGAGPRGRRRGGGGGTGAGATSGNAAAGQSFRSAEPQRGGGERKGGGGKRPHSGLGRAGKPHKKPERARRPGGKQGGGEAHRKTRLKEGRDSSAKVGRQLVPAQQPEQQVFVLQGGGALGAYQAGAYAALHEAGYRPEWLAGISIGAINSAIIAGNPPEQRVARLRQFWDGVSADLTGKPLIASDRNRRLFNETSAMMASAMGIPGFFQPRFPSPLFWPAGAPQALSLYDTAPLKPTLEKLVDFDYLADKGPRLSVGAVALASGNFAYFDSARERICPEHIMASGALPPGFPPVAIGEELYWDGGLVSNTPLQYVLEYSGPRRDMCIFQVDLFNAEGPLPKTIFEVALREKAIRYSSRTRLNTRLFQKIQTLRRAARQLLDRLPPELLDNDDARRLADWSCDAAVTIVHLINRPEAYTLSSMDYEFSRLSVQEHWREGEEDVRQTLAHEDFRNRKRPEEGVAVFDLSDKH